MTLPILTATIGFQKSFTMTLVDAEGNAVTTYTLENALSAKIWAGQDQSELATPDVSWLDPSAGTVTLTLSVSDLESLGGAGTYRLQCCVEDGFGVPSLFFDGAIDVTESAGSTAALSTDITYNDLLGYVPQIAKLQDLSADLAGFANERHRAQTWFRETALNRYRPQPGRSRRYLNADGTGPGSFLAYSTGPNGEPAPSVSEVSGYFSAGVLAMTDQIRETQAHYAASVIYLSQVGRDNPYRQAGQDHRALALALFDSCVIELDTNDPPSNPPVPTIRIDRDCTFLT